MNQIKKLVIMQGLPGSGKSTLAKEMFQPGVNIRLNRDLLREMLHFNTWNRNLEKQTVKAEKALAELFLNMGLDVIIDDTNLAEKTVRMWGDLAAKNEALFCTATTNATLEECIERDKKRGEEGGRCVGEEVIRRMANEQM